MTHDTVLVISKTWGALYLLGVFLLAVLWVYWPSHKKIYEEAARSPLSNEEIKR